MHNWAVHIVTCVSAGALAGIFRYTNVLVTPVPTSLPTGSPTTSYPSTAPSTAPTKSPTKAPTKLPTPAPVCFYKESFVELQHGIKVTLGELKYGDYVLTNLETREYSPVIAFTGYFPHETDTEAVELLTSDGRKLVSSATHLIKTIDGYKSAWKLIPGDKIPCQETTRTCHIEDTRKATRVGWISPLTSSGTIVVNGIQASCHTSVIGFLGHKFGEIAYTPLVWYLKFFGHKDGEKAGDTDHWYSLKKRVIMSQLQLFFNSV